jgi:RNA polymerase sigma-70 factor (ECF subfamily)
MERTGFPQLGCDLPDGLLAARAAEGDDDAFAVLVRRHKPSPARPGLLHAR